MHANLSVTYCTIRQYYKAAQYRRGSADALQLTLYARNWSFWLALVWSCVLNALEWLKLFRCPAGTPVLTWIAMERAGLYAAGLLYSVNRNMASGDDQEISFRSAGLVQTEIQCIYLRCFQSIWTSTRGGQSHKESFPGLSKLWGSKDLRAINEFTTLISILNFTATNWQLWQYTCYSVPRSFLSKSRKVETRNE